MRAKHAHDKITAAQQRACNQIIYSSIPKCKCLFKVDIRILQYIIRYKVKSCRQIPCVSASIYKKFDWLLAVAMLLSSAAGLALVYTATYSYGTARYLLVQACAVVLGYLGMLAVSRLDYGLLLRAAPALYAAMVAALFLGADGRYGQGQQQLAAARLCQPADVRADESVFRPHPDRTSGKSGRTAGRTAACARIAAASASVVVPIVLQKDLGMVVVYLFIFAVMLFAAGLPARYWALALLLALPAARWCWLVSAGRLPARPPSRRGRRTSTRSGGVSGDPVPHRHRRGRHVGRGLSAGRPDPDVDAAEKHTDFIFSVAAEEFGLWGALAVLVLLAFLCLRVLAAARRAKDRGGYLICMGVFASLMFQTVENIGMCLGVLPVVGLTLPLFSYGGSRRL